MTVSRTHGRTRDGRGDLHAGRRFSLAMESLGDALRAQPGFPLEHRNHAGALAEGRSTVPPGGAPVDFVARVREGTVAVEGADALRGWLGDGLAAWVRTDAPTTVLEAVDVAVEARQMLLEPHALLAAACRDWFAAGLPASDAAVVGVASAVALGEAGDRWTALGCEGDLGRYVTTWQRSASGWAETVLGTATDVDVGDLGRLRELSVAVKEMAARADTTGVSAALARRLGWPRAEVERLLKVDAAVKARTDPQAALRRRWAIVAPIALAVRALESTLGRLPTVPEIAAHAGVHVVSVELALETLEAG